MIAWIRKIFGLGRKPAPAPVLIHIHPSLRLEPGKAGLVMRQFYWRQREFAAEQKLELAARQFAAAVLEALRDG